MDTPVFIVAIENDLERYGFDRIVHEKIVQATIIHAPDLHEVHRSLFEHERGVVIVSIDQLDLDNLQQISALARCFVVSPLLS